VRAILHLDMDAFYASVEQRDDPTLKGRQVIVGGHPRRGVVLAASYEVRPLGVHSAMPMTQALRLAPQALVVPPRFEAYVEASQRVQAIFEEVTPLCEPLSLDEAFLDVSDSLSLFGSPAAIARRLRERIRAELQLPCSAGIAASKFVAKIASDLAKPDGQREVLAGETLAFLGPLPVERLFGVGPKTAGTLRRLGLATIGDLAARGERQLAEQLGEAGRALHRLSQGIDDRPVISDRQQKSIGAEDTFEEDTGERERLQQALHAQAWRVGRRLRRAGLRARVIGLKLKSADFQTRHRQTTLPEPTDDDRTIYRAVLTLLSAERLTEPLRLTGVSASGFDATQMPLFSDGAQRRVNQALDRIAEKYGPAAVVPADLVRAIEDDDGEARRQVGGSRLGDPRWR
jgi:DNA polymerase-4